MRILGSGLDNPLTLLVHNDHLDQTEPLVETLMAGIECLVSLLVVLCDDQEECEECEENEDEEEECEQENQEEEECEEVVVSCYEDCEQVALCYENEDEEEECEEVSLLHHVVCLFQAA